MTARAAWSRLVLPAVDLDCFMATHRYGLNDDGAGEPTPAAWLDDDAPYQADGFDPHPLLAAPGDWRSSCRIGGEVRDGRGWHPAATFSPGACGDRGER